MRRTISFVVSVAIAAASMLVAMTASGVISQNFEGLGQDFAGPDGTMVVTAASPDPSGAAGPRPSKFWPMTPLAVMDPSIDAAAIATDTTNEIVRLMQASMGPIRAQSY